MHICTNICMVLFINIMNIKCRICGEDYDPSHSMLEKEMEEHQMCFSCNFWRDMLKKDSKCLPHRVAIIDGSHYIIAPEDDPDPFRGFGGDRFEILFKDGYRVITTNLWYQGEISEHWKEKFPDNAQFVDHDWKWKRDKNGINHLVAQK